MNWFWPATPFTTVLLVFLSALGMYLSIIILTRITGLRSFAKASGFDFATTIAIGALIGGTIVAPDPPLLQAVAAVASLLGLQALVASLRRRSDLLHRWIDNRPRLLMARGEIIQENLDKVRMSRPDLRAKLREAGVMDFSQVCAVVMESTGDVTVLSDQPDAPDLTPAMMEGVIDSERLFGEEETRSRR